MKSSAALLLGCLALAACAGTRGQVRYTLRPPLEGALACELRAPAAIRLGEPMPVKMVIRNISPRPLRILSLATPLMGVSLQNFYDVTCDGQRVRYTDGTVAAYAFSPKPDPGTYRTLPPGGETSGTLDLTKLYGIVLGRCTIHYGRGAVSDAIDDVTIATRPPSEFRIARFECPDIIVDVAPAGP